MLPFLFFVKSDFKFLGEVLIFSFVYREDLEKIHFDFKGVMYK